MGRLSTWVALLRKTTNKKEKTEKQVKQLQRELAAQERKIYDLQNKIDTLNNQQIQLSPHSIARYRERFNPEASEEEIYQELVTEELKYYLQTLGDGQFPSGDKTLIIKDRCIITVY